MVAQSFGATFIRYWRGIGALRQALSQPDPPRGYSVRNLDAQPTVLVLSGASGIGKTFWCHQTFGSHLYDLPLPHRSDLLRWPGFVPGLHTTVLIDEFNGQIAIQDLNRICDRYVFWARTFGGNIQIRPYVIVICTNLDVGDWWGGVYRDPRDPIGQTFRRRITRTISAQTREELLGKLQQVEPWLLAEEVSHIVTIND